MSGNDQQLNSGLTHTIGATILAFLGLLGRSADDVARVGLRNVDDLYRAGISQVDDLVRPTSLVSDDFLRSVDDFPMSKSQFRDANRGLHVDRMQKPYRAAIDESDFHLRCAHEGIDLTVDLMTSSENETIE